MIIADTFDPKAPGAVDWKSVPVELLAAEAADGDKGALAEVARRTGFDKKRKRPVLAVQTKSAAAAVHEGEHAFDEARHPRDGHGRFITVGAHVDLGKGVTGRVVKADASGISVKRDSDGLVVPVHASFLHSVTVKDGPKGSGPGRDVLSRATGRDAPTTPDAPSEPGKAEAPAVPSINVFHPGRYGGEQYLDEASNADEVEQQIEQAFGFEHAETGFRTKWDYGDSRSGKDKLELRGKIVDRDGVGIGVIERSVTRHPDGRVEVHHDLLKIQKESQGQGFADALYRHSLATYPSFGATEVTMEADIDVGGYAWAQRGFDWADEETAKRVHDKASINLELFLKSDAGKALDPAQAERVQAMISRLDAGRDGSQPTLSAKELANSLSDITWTYKTLMGKEIKMWPGKEALLNRNAYWNAVLHLPPAQPQAKSLYDATLGDMSDSTPDEGARGMALEDGQGWLDRMEEELPDAVKHLDPSDAFRPHHGSESDLNIMGADLLAGPDPEFDPFRQASEPADAQATGKKSLSDLVTHTYAASAPREAQWRSSVAHAVDATYGDNDPDVVVKSTRSLIETVYRQGAGSEDLAQAEAEAGRDAS